MLSRISLALMCGLGALFTFTHGLMAQAPGAQTAQPVRFAFVNMQHVFSNYPKYLALQDDLKKEDAKYMEMVKVKESKLVELQKAYSAKDTTQAQKDAIEAEIRSLKAQMEALVSEGKKKMTQAFDEGLSLIIREFMGGCAQLCKDRGYDMVFRYNEDWTNPNDFGRADNIVRRTMSMNFSPVQIPQNLEITGDVLNTMKTMYQQPVIKTGGTTPPAGTGVTPAGGNK